MSSPNYTVEKDCKTGFACCGSLSVEVRSRNPITSLLLPILLSFARERARAARGWGGITFDVQCLAGEVIEYDIHCVVVCFIFGQCSLGFRKQSLVREEKRQEIVAVVFGEFPVSVAGIIFQQGIHAGANAVGFAPQTRKPASNMSDLVENLNANSR